MVKIWSLRMKYALVLAGTLSSLWGILGFRVGPLGFSIGHIGFECDIKMVYTVQAFIETAAMSCQLCLRIIVDSVIKIIQNSHHQLNRYYYL